MLTGMNNDHEYSKQLYCVFAVALRYVKKDLIRDCRGCSVCRYRCPRSGARSQKCDGRDAIKRIRRSNAGICRCEGEAAVQRHLSGTLAVLRTKLSSQRASAE